ncbi:MAG TPA: helix-turn-helix transcriptional regulator [Verrucomicrobiae bacterium]
MTETKSTKAPERFIRLLKKKMQEHPGRMSLSQVARNADLSPAYLSLLLNGERGVPSNDAISQLEQVLDIAKGELFKAAGRPDDQALEFFRKDEAGSIMRTLAPLPNSQLSAIRKLIEQFVQKQNRAKSK